MEHPYRPLDQYTPHTPTIKGSVFGGLVNHISIFNFPRGDGTGQVLDQIPQHQADQLPSGVAVCGGRVLRIASSLLPSQRSFYAVSALWRDAFHSKSPYNDFAGRLT